jgi:hypothetical protein
MLQYKQIFIKALAFLTGTPHAPQSPELSSDILIYQLNLPIIELAEVNIMGSDLFFLCVDLELGKIVVYFSFFKALYPAFPYLVDSSPPVVTDSRVPGLPGSQKFQSIFSLSSIPATFAPFPMHINHAFISDNSPNTSKILALIGEKVKDISH